MRSVVVVFERPLLHGLLGLCLAHSFLLLPATKTKTLRHAPKPKATKQLVDAETPQNTIHEATQPQRVQQLPHKTQHTTEQQPHGRDDLEQWFREQSPEGVQLLLCVRHVVDALLRIVDRLDDDGGEFLEALGDAVLFGRSFTGGRFGFGLCRDMSIGIETADRAVAFAKNAATFFDQRLDVLDEFLFVKLLAGCAVGFLDVLLHVC
jgi:hypothetical protein